MTEDVWKCARCGRTMVLVKETLLCVTCDAQLLWDLNTPFTIEEQNKWVDNNLGVVKHDNKTTKKKS